MKGVGLGYPRWAGACGTLGLSCHEQIPADGSWKAQRRVAQLRNADVLRLDEPSGHWDAGNVKWLEDWRGPFNGSAVCTRPFVIMFTHFSMHNISATSSRPNASRASL